MLALEAGSCPAMSSGPRGPWVPGVLVTSAGARAAGLSATRVAAICFCDPRLASFFADCVDPLQSERERFSIGFHRFSIGFHRFS